MKFFSTTGKEYNIDIKPSRWPRRDKENCKSAIQWNVGQILADVFPHDVILEEFFLKGDGLYIDFFLPRKRLAVEVHGRQHYEYVEHFHRGKSKFLAAKNRDARKYAWCKMNNIRLVEIKYDEEDESVRNKIGN